MFTCMNCDNTPCLCPEKPSVPVNEPWKFFEACIIQDPILSEYLRKLGQQLAIEIDKQIMKDYIKDKDADLPI